MEEKICEFCHKAEAVGSVGGLLVCRDCGPDAMMAMMREAFKRKERAAE
jgi:hypothetical protein